jgi:hypothetical protein
MYQVETNRQILVYSIIPVVAMLKGRITRLISRPAIRSDVGLRPDQ